MQDGEQREVQKPLLARAERRVAADGTPILWTLVEEGQLPTSELHELTDLVGRESLFDFLSSGEPLKYRYRPLENLPDYALQHDTLLDVTPILLDVNSRMNHWQSMLPVFPDPDQPLRKAQDHLRAMADLNLDMVQLKILALMKDDDTPRTLALAVGLPLPDLYENLLFFAQEGILEPNCSLEVLTDVMLGG